MSSGGTVVELTPSTPWARLMQAVRAHAHVLVVWAAMTAWSVVMFATVRDDYLGYRLGRFDLGNMTPGGVEHRARTLPRQHGHLRGSRRPGLRVTSIRFSQCSCRCGSSHRRH